MPIANYSVLAGRPTAGKVVTGASAHYQITMQAAGGPFTVAVNIQSVDGSEVLYAIEEGFTPPDLAGLMALPMGMTKLQSEAGGLALDYVRSTVGGASDDYEGADDVAAAVECTGEEWWGGGADDSAGEGQGVRECCGDAAEYDDCG